MGNWSSVETEVLYKFDFRNLSHVEILLDLHKKNEELELANVGVLENYIIKETQNLGFMIPEIEHDGIWCVKVGKATLYASKFFEFDGDTLSEALLETLRWLLTEGKYESEKIRKWLIEQSRKHNNTSI